VLSHICNTHTLRCRYPHRDSKKQVRCRNTRRSPEDLSTLFDLLQLDIEFFHTSQPSSCPLLAMFHPLLATVSPSHGYVSPSHGCVAPFPGYFSPFHGCVYVSPSHCCVSPYHGYVAPSHGCVSPSHGYISPPHGYIILRRRSQGRTSMRRTRP
jgi:hypothetical protein